jgi:Holliday junction resolvasome RuvABC endonuclease subunit
MKIIGVDYSYTSPSICLLGEDFKSSLFYFANANKKLAITAQNYEGFLLDKDHIDNVERYEKIANWAVEKIMQHHTPNTKVYMEGYAYGARGGMLFNIAENGGLFKFLLKQATGIHPIIVAPTSVKKSFSGKGNSNKDAMVQYLLDSEGVDIVSWMQMNKLGSPAHDVVDSYAIAKHGEKLENA